MNDDTHADTPERDWNEPLTSSERGHIAQQIIAGAGHGWLGFLYKTYEASLAELDRERARADQATAIVERFHEAWWNWNPGDETEPLDAAASEAMSFLGTVISLNPESA